MALAFFSLPSLLILSRGIVGPVEPGLAAFGLGLTGTGFALMLILPRWTDRWTLRFLHIIGGRLVGASSLSLWGPTFVVDNGITLVFARLGVTFVAFLDRSGRILVPTIREAKSWLFHAYLPGLRKVFRFNRGSDPETTRHFAEFAQLLGASPRWLGVATLRSKTVEAKRPDFVAVADFLVGFQNPPEKLIFESLDGMRDFLAEIARATERRPSP